MTLSTTHLADLEESGLSEETIRPPVFENIPEELRQCPQWVVWKLEQVGGKQTKVPYDPKTGRKASSTDTATWADFETAKRAFLKGSGYTGIGFVFSKNGAYSGVDLDHSIQDGHLMPWAESIVKELNSYTELSPRGEGLHVIVKGKKPGPRCKKACESGEVEIYSDSRFFTFTGVHLERTPFEIHDRQNELSRVYYQVFGKDDKTKEEPKFQNLANLDDAEVIERACKAANGNKFKRLWDGDYLDYQSHSEADQAFCNHLAFWCGMIPQLSTGFSVKVGSTVRNGTKGIMVTAGRTGRSA